MNKIFIGLWSVVGLFLLGLALVFIAAFTTHEAKFSGQGDLYLKFAADDHAVAIHLADDNQNPIMVDTDGQALLHPKFEDRDANIFETYNDGPLPRRASVAFFDSSHKHHLLTVTYDRYGHVWQTEVAIPDPFISEVQVIDSSLVFKGTDGERRKFESVIHAVALIGPPIIKND